MKRYSKVIVLLVLLVLICTAIYIVNRHEEKKEEIESTDEIILQIDSDDVTSLSWEVTDSSDDTDDTDDTGDTDDTDGSGASFAFHKDGTWVYDEDENFPVDQEKINDILSVFSEMGAAFTISDVEDYDQYGLEEPKCTIHFQTEDQEYEVKLGDYSTMDEERYVSIGDGKVYLLSSDPYDTFDVELSSLIQNDDVPVLSQISSVKFSGACDYTIYESDTNNVTYSEDDKYFTDTENGTIAMDTSLVDSYLGSIEGVSLTEYVTYNATEDELSEYGLDAPELVATIEYTETEVTEESDDTSDDTEQTETDTEDTETGDDELSTFVISIARSEKAQAEEAETTEDTETDASDSTASETTDSSDEDTEYAYVRIGDSKIIYSISEDTYQTLMKANVSDLRHQKLVWADTDDIYQIDVTIDGASYVLKSENAPEEDAADTEDIEATTEVTTTESDTSDEGDQTDSGEEEKIKWYYGTEEVDAASVQSALSSLTATEFTTDTSTGKEEFSMTISIDNANVSEVTLTFYRYDGTTCLAEVNGEPLAYVSRSSVVDLIEAVNEIVL